jgi:hypothetical protein
MKRSLFSGLFLLCAIAVAAPVALAQAYITAAINWPGDKAQFFLSDGTYVRYDMATDRADAGYPKPVSNSNWPGLGGEGRYITAAFNGVNGKAYFFFSDGTYSRYDIGADHVDEGYPQRVTNENWPGLAAYAQKITAAVNWNNGKVYFFLSDGSYLRYDLDADRTDAGYPMMVEHSTWPGLAPYASMISGAVNWQNGKVYFFLNSGQYLRYDVAGDHVDSGYPLDISAQTWPGLHGFFRITDKNGVTSSH